MDTPIRGTSPPRSQLLFGLQAQIANPRRPRPDERVDLPEIQESTRVSFSKGAAVQSSLPSRSGVDLYRAIQQL